MIYEHSLEKSNNPRSHLRSEPARAGHGCCGRGPAASRLGDPQQDRFEVREQETIKPILNFLNCNFF